MTLNLKYEGYEIEFDIRGTEDEGAEIEDVTIWEGETEVKLENIGEHERKMIEKKMEDLANENSWEDWNERQIMKAEAAYDAWKDGTYE